MNQEQIGKWIAFLRKEKKLTQEQFAERLGVTNRSVSRWENGRSMPDFSLLWDIARELDVSVAELLNGKREEAEKDTGMSGSIDVLLTWVFQEKQRKSKKLGQYFKAGMFCLLLALLQAQFGVVSLLLPDGPKELITGILTALGVLLEVLGFSCNRLNSLMTQREIELLSKNGGMIKMKNAQEMLRFAQKYHSTERKFFKAAFAELEKNLKKDESAVFSAAGDSYSRNELQMMWYVVLAVTETRLLISGQRMKGMIMVRYDTEAFMLSDVTRIAQSGSAVVIQVAGMELKIEIGNHTAAAEMAQDIRKVIGTE